MILNYSFTYTACQSCHAKIKCDQCQEQISEMLMRIRGVQRVEMNIPRKTLVIEVENVNRYDIEDALEEVGVFID